MTVHARLRHQRLAAVCIALFLSTGLLTGCAGGPKFSRISPSDWPGIKQVRGAGKSVGSWVADKAKQEPRSRETASARVANRRSVRKSDRETTNEKLQSIFAAANNPSDNQPTDPFLAQLTEQDPSVEIASHSDESPFSAPSSDRKSRKKDLQPVAHSLNGPEVSTPERPTEKEPVDNPFADFASAAKERKESTTETVESQSFAESIDAQLARLREEARVPESTHKLDRQPAETNPLRDAIFGVTDQKSADLIASLPATNKPATTETVEPTTDNPFGAVNDNVDRKEAAEDVGLPAWARDASDDSPAPKLPIERKSIPVSESSNEVPVTMPIAESTAESSEPPTAEPAGPTIDVPMAERTRVATNEDERPPSAIEIVPFDGNVSVPIPPDDIPTAVDAATTEQDASRLVELLPAPVESANTVDAGEAVRRQQGDDGSNGMIVESDALPLGFVEWDDARSETSEDQRSDRKTMTLSTSMSKQVPTGFAANSNQPGTVDNASSVTTNDASIAHNVEQPRFLRDIPESPVVEATPADVMTPPALDPHLFDASSQGAAVVESSLDTINWAPETEPHEKTATSPFGSTAVIGLLIALACLMGLGLIRRLRTA